MDLAGIMWNKSVRKTNTMWFHLYVESKEQYKWTNKTEADLWTQSTDWWLPEGREFGGLGEKGEGIEKYKWVVTK